MPRVTGYLKYTTRAGDTYDTLALTMYNDEKLASRIIDFNPDYSDVIVFDAGVQLRLPIVEGAPAPSTLPPWRK